mgnify:CR=1 FL=1
MPIIPTEEAQLFTQLRRRNNNNDPAQITNNIQNDNTHENTVNQNINHQEELTTPILTLLDDAMNITQNEIAISG